MSDIRNLSHNNSRREKHWLDNDTTHSMKLSGDYVVIVNGKEASEYIGLKLHE